MSFTLRKYQEKAVKDLLSNSQDFIEENFDESKILFQSPTGSGKTLPAEFAIYYFNESGKKVIYTTPVKALSNEKFHDLSKKFPDISFGLSTKQHCYNLLFHRFHLSRIRNFELVL